MDIPKGQTKNCELIFFSGQRGRTLALFLFLLIGKTANGTNVHHLNVAKDKPEIELFAIPFKYQNIHHIKSTVLSL